MNLLSIKLLGPPQVSLDDEPIRLGRRKALALLAYLAANPAIHQRDSLATLLWPESDHTSARANLRRTLSELKRQLDHDHFETDLESIGLCMDAGVEVDLAKFRQLLSRGQPEWQDGAGSESSGGLTDLAAAVDLVRGPFLEGFSLADSVLYDDWQMFQTEAIRRDVMDALSLLTRGYQASGNPDRAIGYAYRWVELDPFNGRANQSVMTLLAETDQPTSALRHFRSYERLLDEEFGIEPDDEILELFERIRSGRFAEPEAGDSPPGIVDQVTARPDVPDAPKFVLPRQMTSFVGRRQEIDEIGHLLCQEPNCRLVTLTGAGGVGKTRLALSAAQVMAHEFADGVCFTPLVGVTDPSLVLSSIAQGLNLQASSRSSLKMQLFSFLSSKSLLLVLDNVEQLLAEQETGAETFPKLVLELLTGAQDLRLLITSREPLDIQPEWIVPVNGLSFPNSEEPISDGDRTLERYGAMELFYHRVRRLFVDFDWREEWAAVVRICRCVDGLPLAIELAAPWTQSLTCDEIADQIEQDMDVLTTTLRDVEPRHRSIRSVFEQTWQMLSGEEQHVLSRLSVFRNGFTRLAAEQIAGATLPLLTSLVGKTLLRRDQPGRYDSQELLRQFCADKLATNPAALVRTRDRHAAYFTSLLAHSYDDLLWRRPVETYWALSAEMDNINAAWAWAVERGDLAAMDRAFEVYWQLLDWRGAGHEIIAVFGHAVDRVEAMHGEDLAAERLRLRLLGELLVPYGQRLYDSLELRTEGRAVVERGLALIREKKPADRRKVFWALIRASFTYWEPCPEEAEPLLLECMKIAEDIGEREGLSLACAYMSVMLQLQGKRTKAKDYLVRSLASGSRHGEQRWSLITLEQQAMMAINEGDYDLATEVAEQCLQTARKIENRHAVCSALAMQGLLARIDGDFVKALRLHEQALQISDKSGVPDLKPIFLLNLSALNRLMERYEASACHLEESATFVYDLHILSPARLLAERGRLAYARQDYAAAVTYLTEAVTVAPISLNFNDFETPLVDLADALVANDSAGAWHWYEQALQQSRDGDALPFALEALGGLARSLEQTGDPGQAFELACLVQSHPATWYEHRVRAQALARRLEETLPSTFVAAAQDTAQHQDPWAVVDEVLAMSSPAKD